MSRIFDTSWGPMQVVTPPEFEIATFLRFEAKLQRRYEPQSDGKWKCRTCGSIVLATPVLHVVPNDPSSSSGKARIIKEHAPYCPACEEKPRPMGFFVAPKGSCYNP